MSEIKVKIWGVEKSVDPDKLREMAAKKYISPESTIEVNGQKYRLSDFLNGQGPGKATISPDGTRVEFSFSTNSSGLKPLSRDSGLDLLDGSTPVSQVFTPDDFKMNSEGNRAQNAGASGNAAQNLDAGRDLGTEFRNEQEARREKAFNRVLNVIEIVVGCFGVLGLIAACFLTTSGEKRRSSENDVEASAVVENEESDANADPFSDPNAEASERENDQKTEETDESTAASNESALDEANDGSPQDGADANANVVENAAENAGAENDAIDEKFFGESNDAFNDDALPVGDSEDSAAARGSKNKAEDDAKTDPIEDGAIEDEPIANDPIEDELGESGAVEDERDEFLAEARSSDAQEEPARFNRADSRSTDEGWDPVAEEFFGGSSDEDGESRNRPQNLKVSVPDRLEEALETLAETGGTLELAPNSKPYQLRNEIDFTNVDVTIKSETGDPNDVTIGVAPRANGAASQNAGLNVLDARLNMTGITLRFYGRAVGPGASNYLIGARKGSKITFRNCAFEGRSPRQGVGVLAKNASASVRFADSVFHDLEYGVHALDSASVEFDGECAFTGNGVGFLVEDGASGRCVGARFEKNKLGCKIGADVKFEIGACEFVENDDDRDVSKHARFQDLNEDDEQ